MSGGRWFTDNVFKKIGNGSNVMYWHESWLGGEVVNERFSRLFSLAMEKNVSMNDMMFGMGV